MLRHIGANVHRLRVRAGWTQADMAEAAGLEPRSVTRIEHAQIAPTLQTLVRLAADPSRATAEATQELTSGAPRATFNRHQERPACAGTATCDAARCQDDAAGR